MEYLVDLLLGLAFGFVLQKTGLGEYHRVSGQFRLRDFTMLKFMLTAIAVGAVLTFALRVAGVVDDSARPSDAILPALVGGAVLGCGMAVAGMCPGTVLAGIGRGSVDYLVPGLAGMLAGALVLGAIFEPVVLPMHVGEGAAALPAAGVAPGPGASGDGAYGGGTAGVGDAGAGGGGGPDAAPGEASSGSAPTGADPPAASAVAGVAFAEPDEFRALADAGELPVLDVRTKAKFEMFEMPWPAENVPLVQLAARADEVPAADGLLLVASNDDESLRAADALAALGVSPERLRALSGGTDRWIAENRPYTFNPSLIAC